MINQKNEIIFTGFFILLFSILFFPLPAFFLDFFIILSFIVSILILYSTLFAKNFLELSTFPTLLLLFTLFRLVLNIATTKMILIQADAGKIINTFSHYVVGESLVIGFILFSLLTIVNFIVVTKGSSRIAEVKARFALEGMAGKQLAVDADLKSGSISSDEAKLQRGHIIQEANFYGAMDGAAKFVKGDAIAGLLIIFINLAGGMIKGCILDGLKIDQAVYLYMHLAIGDGLVSQIPALIVSLAAGIILTREASIGSTATSLFRQILKNPSLIASCLITVALGFLPGMPHLLTFFIGIGGFYLSRFFKKQKEDKNDASINGHTLKKDTEGSENLYLLELEIGTSLIGNLEPIQSALTDAKLEIKNEFGISVPAMKIKDSSSCPAKGYVLKIKGFETPIVYLNGEGQLYIKSALKSSLQKILYELLTRTSVLEIIEHVRKYDPNVVDEIYPQKLCLGQLFKIFQNLLKEGITLKNPIVIFETLADQLINEKNTSLNLEELCECVRRKMSVQLTQNYLGSNKTLHAIVLDSQVEQMMLASLNKSGKLLIRPSTGKKIGVELNRLFQISLSKGMRPVILTDRENRTPLKKWIENFLPDAPVFAYSELPPETDIKTIGRLSTDLLL